MDQQRAEAHETAQGYELDTITLRDIAAVRYVRHHEWLGHIVGSSLPTSNITPPKIECPMSEAELQQALEKTTKEVERLKAEKEKGWKFEVDEDKAKVLSEEIARLRDGFGTEVLEESVKRVEQVLKRPIIPIETLNPVKVTYDRKKEEAEAAAQSEDVEMSEAA